MGSSLDWSYSLSAVSTPSSPSPPPPAPHPHPTHTHTHIPSYQRSSLPWCNNYDIVFRHDIRVETDSSQPFLNHMTLRMNDLISSGSRQPASSYFLPKRHTNNLWPCSLLEGSLMLPITHAPTSRGPYSLEWNQHDRLPQTLPPFWDLTDLMARE